MKKEKWKFCFYKIILNFNIKAKLININLIHIKMTMKKQILKLQLCLDNKRKLNQESKIQKTITSSRRNFEKEAA